MSGLLGVGRRPEGLLEGGRDPEGSLEVGRSPKGLLEVGRPSKLGLGYAGSEGSWSPPTGALKGTLWRDPKGSLPLCGVRGSWSPGRKEPSKLGPLLASAAELAKASSLLLVTMRGPRAPGALGRRRGPQPRRPGPCAPEGAWARSGTPFGVPDAGCSAHMRKSGL